MSARKSRTGICSFAISQFSVRRPSCQVVISTYTMIAAAMGSQPPSSNLSMLDRKNARSMNTRNPSTTVIRPKRGLSPEVQQQQHQDAVDQHRARDGDAVGARQCGGRLKSKHDEHRADEQQPVHAWHIDLPDLVLRRMQHAQSRQIAEIQRLARDREHAGNHGLRGDDRRRGGEHDERRQEPARCEQIERIGDGLRVRAAATRPVRSS